MSSSGGGLLLLALSGVSTASFALPLKGSRAWAWENTWFVYALFALVLIPGAIAVMLTPHLADVYRSIGPGSLLLPVLFGFLWGIAQLTFGLAIRSVGMAMAFAIVIGLSAVLGSAIPFAVFHPEGLKHGAGLLLMVSAAILIAGLLRYAKAGRRRERELQLMAPSAGDFRTGLLLCVFTGCFGSMLNLGFVFGASISDRAVQLGASTTNATFAVWAVVLAVGYIPSFAYSAWLLVANKTSGRFRLAPLRESSLAIAAAVLWSFGMLGYGVGAAKMGSYGTSIGFALAQSILLLWSNALGWFAGEWKHVSAATRQTMFGAVAIILAAVLTLGLGSLAL